MTDGNTYAINKHLDEREDYDALQEVTQSLSRQRHGLRRWKPSYLRAKLYWRRRP